MWAGHFDPENQAAVDRHRTANRMPTHTQRRQSRPRLAHGGGGALLGVPRKEPDRSSTG